MNALSEYMTALLEYLDHKGAACSTRVEGLQPLSYHTRLCLYVFTLTAE